MSRYTPTTIHAAQEFRSLCRRAPAPTRPPRTLKEVIAEPRSRRLQSFKNVVDKRTGMLRRVATTPPPPTA